MSGPEGIRFYIEQILAHCQFNSLTKINFIKFIMLLFQTPFIDPISAPNPLPPPIVAPVSVCNAPPSTPLPQNQDFSVLFHSRTLTHGKEVVTLCLCHRHSLPRRLPMCRPGVA